MDANEIYISIEVNASNADPHSIPHAPVDMAVHGVNKGTAVVEKIRRTIRKAREQHEQKTGFRLVVFIDSEELPDFRPGILQGTDMMNDVDVRRRIRDAIGDAIVVITRRSYENRQMRTTSHFFCNVADINTVKVLQRVLGPQAQRLELDKPSLDDIFRIGLLSQ